MAKEHDLTKDELLLIEAIATADEPKLHNLTKMFTATQEQFGAGSKAAVLAGLMLELCALKRAELNTIAKASLETLLKLMDADIKTTPETNKSRELQVEVRDELARDIKESETFHPGGWAFRLRLPDVTWGAEVVSWSKAIIGKAVAKVSADLEREREQS